MLFGCVFYFWGCTRPVHYCQPVFSPGLIGFLEMFNSCISCQAPLEPEDGHRECPSCLGVEHLRQGLTELACADCMCLSVAARTARLANVGPMTDSTQASGGQAAKVTPAAKVTTAARPGKHSGVATRPTCTATDQRPGDLAQRVDRMAADLEEMKALLISLQPQQAQGVSAHAHTPPPWQPVRSPSPPQLSPVTEARSLDVLSIQASESMDCGDSEAHDSASQAASQASSHGTATALETGRSSIQPALKAALARLGLDTPPVAQPQQSAFFRGPTQPPTLEVPPSAPFIEELQRCWADPSRLSHLPSDCRALAAMQDASSYGLQRMPSIEPSVAALVLSPNEALRPDARCPRAQCRVTDDLIVRSYDTAARMGRIGNAMSHLMLALAQTLQGPHAASQELCEAALQAFAYSSRELGRLMSYLTIARRQIWLAQSPLAEADRRVLRSLPVLPGELFGQAAQQALDRSAQVVQARQQYAGLRQVYRRSNTAATSRGPATAPAPPPPPPPRPRTRQESRRAEDFRRPTTTRTRRAAPYGQPAPRRPPDERRGRSGRR